MSQDPKISYGDGPTIGLSSAAASYDQNFNQGGGQGYVGVTSSGTHHQIIM